MTRVLASLQVGTNVEVRADGRYYARVEIQRKDGGGFTAAVCLNTMQLGRQLLPFDVAEMIRCQLREQQRRQALQFTGNYSPSEFRFLTQ